MKPYTGRNESFLKVIEILCKEYKSPITIVETGCIRNITEESKIGDGWSTVNWEYYCKKTNSKVFVVDINSQHIAQSKSIIPESTFVEYIESDSVEYLKRFSGKIDLLYLDSYDYCGDMENIIKCHNHSLNEVKASFNKLNEKCFILIDDIFNEQWDGKGKLSIPYLLDKGFQLVYFTSSQVLLQRK